MTVKIVRHVWARKVEVPNTVKGAKGPWLDMLPACLYPAANIS